MRSRASGAARLDASFAGFATRSCAIGAEALARQLNEVFAFLGRAMLDRAARASLPVTKASANQIG